MSTTVGELLASRLAAINEAVRREDFRHLQHIRALAAEPDVDIGGRPVPVLELVDPKPPARPVEIVEEFELAVRSTQSVRVSDTVRRNREGKLTGGIPGMLDAGGSLVGELVESGTRRRKTDHRATIKFKATYSAGS